MTAFQPSDTLKSRTYLGLILSQSLAAFNDQASHIVAIFYAIDMLVRYAAVPHLDEKALITVVTACFIAPFFVFSPLAGLLADKYSKRSILVGWKVAEVGMMGLGLLGFLLPHAAGLGVGSPRLLAIWSAVLVVAVVFLMGTHSAFFVPAKYGVMPEILQPTVLSRGNGFLEGTSFVAQIFGVWFAGLLYGLLKSRLPDPVHGTGFRPGQEWVIGLVLLLLAIAGAFGSWLIARMPAAAPDLPLTWKLWRPLKVNISVLWHSRPLALSVLGIAFFTFMTLFLRQTIIYQGEIANDLQQAALHAGELPSSDNLPATPDFGVLRRAPGRLGPLINYIRRQPAEILIAMLIGLVGLGVGFGSPLAGYLSGNKVELGLVPIGASFLALITALLGLLTRLIPISHPVPRAVSMATCLMLIGVAASLYIVPLYTLLQHRAPKDSKGNLVATSNFVNVAGGLVAVAVFYLLTVLLGRLFGFDSHPNADQLTTKLYLGPSTLFLAASLLTVAMLVLLCRQLPDFFVRSLLWLRSHGRYRLKVIGLNNLPSNGPVILATNCDGFDSAMQVVAATDRFTRFILLESTTDPEPRPLLLFLARRTGLVALRQGTAARPRWQRALAKAGQTLKEGNLLAVTVDSDWPPSEVEQFLDDLRACGSAVLLPVYCGAMGASPEDQEAISRVRRVRVVIGQPLRPGATVEDMRQAIHFLGEWTQRSEQAEAAASVLIPAASGASPTVPATDRPALP